MANTNFVPKGVYLVQDGDVNTLIQGAILKAGVLANLRATDIMLEQIDMTFQDYSGDYTAVSFIRSGTNPALINFQGQPNVSSGRVQKEIWLNVDGKIRTAPLEFNKYDVLGHDPKNFNAQALFVKDVNELTIKVRRMIDMYALSKFFNAPADYNANKGLGDSAPEEIVHGLTLKFDTAEDIIQSGTDLWIFFKKQVRAFKKKGLITAKGTLDKLTYILGRPTNGLIELVPPEWIDAMIYAYADIGQTTAEMRKEVNGINIGGLNLIATDFLPMNKAVGEFKKNSDGTPFDITDPANYGTIKATTVDFDFVGVENDVASATVIDAILMYADKSAWMGYIRMSAYTSPVLNTNGAYSYFQDYQFQFGIKDKDRAIYYTHVNA
jgi:hypothetical protein